MIALLACASLALPLVVFRGTTLRRYLAFEIGSWGLVLMAWRLAPPADFYFATIAVAVVKLAAFSVVLAVGRDVRWSATRAAVVTAIVFAFVVPSQMRTPIDGDEPFYLLVTESLVRDHDFDLANQYRDLRHSATGRVDLVPQPGDPVGSHGEKYSRLEPFLSVLLIPGYLAAGLPGALATIAIFGVLLVRSTVRLLEEEGIGEETVRALFPFFAFAPPVVFYAARIWPEVPGALCFVECLRGVRRRELRRALPALFALVMLKLRFGLSGIILAGAIVRDRIRRTGSVTLPRVALIGGIVLVPLVVVWAITGNLLNVHSWRELLPLPLPNYLRGAFGLLLDGAAGLLFQAPFYLVGVFALTRWHSMPATARLGAIAALPYVVSLIPRSEWHGGWSPPLRYIVVFMPLLLLAAAALIERGAKAGAWLAIAAVWTIGITIHGLVYPWRLFHIANGENPAGEWLSELYRADFSRLFPSFIRLNFAAVVAAIVLVVVFVVLRWVRVPAMLVAPAFALALAFGYAYAQTPADVVEFEDAHVIHRGGELYPQQYTVARFLYRAGWKLRSGDSVSFLAQAGNWELEYACATPAHIEIGGHEVTLPPTGNDHAKARVEIPRSGRVELRCINGTVDLDRMAHE